MATYLLFGKYTSGAIKGISASRTEKAVKLINKFNGEVNSMYALLGDKDMLLIVNFPNAEQAMKASIALSRLTDITFTTAQAISIDEFDKIIADI